MEILWQEQELNQVGYLLDGGDVFQVLLHP